MEYNSNMIKGKWLELKGNIQKTWGKITDDELEKTKGDMKAVAGLIQQRYAEQKETFGKKLDDIYSSVITSKDEKIEETKDKLKTNH